MRTNPQLALCKTPMPRDADPAFARGNTSLFGKFSEAPINGLKVPTEVKERLEAMAHEANLPFHEFLREKLTLSAFGREEVERRFRDRWDAIEGSLKD